MMENIIIRLLFVRAFGGISIEMSYGIRIRELFIFICLFAAFLIQTVFQQYQNYAFGLMIIIILVALTILLAQHFRIKDNRLRNILKTYLFRNMEIKILIHVYSIILIILNIANKDTFSLNLITYINAVTAVATVYILRERTWMVSLSALAFTWIVSVVIQVNKYGTGFFENLEFHDLAFGTGFILLYYAVFKTNWNNKQLIAFIIVLLITVTAAKRIAVGAIFVVLVFHFLIIRKKNYINKRQVIDIISIAFIVLSFFFVYIIIDNSFFTFLSQHVKSVGDFLMGRNYYWKALAEECRFSLDFLGHGKNASSVLFTGTYAYMRVGNAHSDILRNFMEDGFILFGVWLYHYFFRFRKCISRRISNENAYVYFIMTLYLFLTYLTDNTESYLITQYFYILCPLSLAIRCYKKPKNINNGLN